MPETIFVGGLAAAYILVLWWSCRKLPGEKWQILAAVPETHDGSGSWRGLNITYYGFFLAGATTIALALLLVMLGAIGLRPAEMAALLVPLLAFCLPASRKVAKIVEKKPQTITVAGATFVGLLVTPALVLAGDFVFDPPVSRLLPIMAALSISNAFGEGLGRLACISFGCCYGKPLDQCPGFLQRLFRGRGFIFTGPTKKIAYAGHLDGVPVLPIQAITSSVNVGAGLVGLYLYLQGHFTLTFLLVVLLTQGWRAYSETLRADYRGGGRLSAYQWMAVAACVFALVVAFWAPTAGIPSPVLGNGLALLWNPATLLVLQALWFGLLLSYGRSKVTASTIHFHVIQSNI